MDQTTKFKNEVLVNGPEAVLPKNLSDSWLEVLSQQAEIAMNSDSDQDQITELVASVITILFSRNNGNELSVDLPDLQNHIESYGLEIAMEVINRKTQLYISEADLDTIMRDRIVEVHNS